MNQKDLSDAKDPDLISSLEAMKRAAAMARKIAVQTGTGIVVVKDHKLVLVTAEELLDKGKA